MKKIFNVSNAVTPIISVVSLFGCIVLSVVCTTMNNKLKEIKVSITNYASDPYFLKTDDKYYSLRGIINQHEQQIDQLRNNLSNFQRDLNRSNRFLQDYNTAKFFDDDWPMKQQY
jgi:septal ring factor EnvC (AmiA/AmiB activator)